ncbi:SH3 domain-containing protein [Devosia sp.]|uniref:SH3 domain-containing protein n=1 Tax=Devosia sp. TaxID=1871048 RepID=UPI002F0261DB
MVASRPHRHALAALAALALVLPGTLPALAGEARASGDVPVRRGPGEDYRVIDCLVDGAYYEVEDCTRRARWCLVSEDGELLGWVRGSYLVGSAAKNRVTPFEFLVTPEFFRRRH